jgi:hypothetical protein
MGIALTLKQYLEDHDIGTLGLVRAAPNGGSPANVVFGARVPQQKCYRSHRSLVIWGMSASTLWGGPCHDWRRANSS